MDSALEEGDVNEHDVTQIKSESLSTVASDTKSSLHTRIGRENRAAITKSGTDVLESRDLLEPTFQGMDSVAKESISEIKNSSVVEPMTVAGRFTVAESNAHDILEPLPRSSSRSIQLKNSTVNPDQDRTCTPGLIQQNSSDLASGEEDFETGFETLSKMSSIKNLQDNSDITQKEITTKLKSKASTTSEYSRTGKKCRHTKTFLSCVQCRQALFKSNRRLQHQLSHRFEKHNHRRQLHESNGKSMKTSQQSQVQGSRAPFPSGGQIPSHHQRTLNDDFRTSVDKPGFEGKWASGISNSESTSCSEYRYESSNRDLSSESSFYGLKGSPIIIGRGNAQFNHPFKPGNQQENGTLQIGLRKLKIYDQSEVRSSYDNTPAYFLSCDQRIVIGEENTSKKDVMTSKESTATAVHPCGCEKPSEQSPRSDQELDDEKIVEKAHRMFRPHSPAIDDDHNDTSECVPSGGSKLKKQSHDSTLTDTADASVQTSARDMAIDSNIEKGYNSRSQRWNLSSSLDSDSTVESFELIEDTKKTRPFYSSRSKSKITASNKNCKDSSNNAMTPKVLDGKVKKSSVMDLFDELRNELNNLGTIIDTSKIGKNRDAGILSDTFKPKGPMNVATSRPVQKISNQPLSEVRRLKIGSFPVGGQLSENSLNTDIDEESMNS